MGLGPNRFAVQQYVKMNKAVIGMALLLLVMASMTVYPLAIILYGSLNSGVPGAPGVFTLNGYREAFGDISIAKVLWTTIWLGAARTLLSAALAIFFCWVIVRTDTPWRGSLEFFFWVNFFLPHLPIVLGWILLLDPSFGLVNELLRRSAIDFPLNIYSYGGIIWAHLAFSVSTKVLLLTPAFRNMDAALEEASTTSGSSQFGTLVRITLPLLAPAVLGITLLTFIRSLESFETEFLLGSPAKIYVYSTKVYDMLRWEPPRYPPAMALSSVFMASVIVVVLIYRFVIAGREYSTVTGRGYRPTTIKLGKWKYLTLSVSLIYLAIFTFLPLCVLVLGTFMRIAGMFSLPNPYTLNHWRDVLADPVFLESVTNSFYLAGGAALIGMLFYSLVSYVITKSHVQGRRVLEFMTWLPWGVPGVLLAVGILWGVLGTFKFLVILYGTPFLLIIAILIKELPVGVRTMDGALVQVHTELEESARVAGDSWLGTFRRIMVPLLSPAFLAVGVIIFLTAMKEISTIILLYSTDTRVLSVLMLEHYIGNSPEKAMVVGTIITAFVMVTALVARRVGLRIGVRE
jgi:iron(III) transport system permease protein